LLLKLDHIGDLLLALPAVEVLRSAWPGGDFTLVCSPVSEALARSSQLFDRVIPHKFSPELSEDLRKSGVSQYEKIKALLEDTFEIAMDLRHDPDTRPHLAFVDSKIKVGFQSHGKYYTPLDISLQPISDRVGLHAPLHNLHRLMLLANHTVNSLSQTPFATLGKSLIASGTANLPLTTKHYVVFAPGGGTKAKKWPVASFVQLSRLVMESPAVTLVLIGGPAEFEYSVSISRSIRDDRLVDLIGKLPLTDLASVISGAAAFVGTDTGATHLAALLGVPTVSIFSGVADVNVWGPLGSNVTTIQTKVGCAPCQISRLEQCVADHACMTLIEPATVYEELLKRARFNDSNRD
jgi:ADP-heptose:LPS heptosyltransferase